MYNERKENFSLKDFAIQILFVVLFVFILIWLFPSKSFIKENVGQNQVANKEMVHDALFNENVMMMKDAATSYYTKSRLPEKVGDSKTLTLREMLDNKLILSFVDSNGNQCDLDESYVKITKMDDEYRMKVNLTCSSKSDYIMVHMGCYSYCDTAICEKEVVEKVDSKKTTKPKTLKNVKYEYALPIKTSVTATPKNQYTCPIGYSLSGSTCYRAESSSATESPTYNTTSSCPYGYTASASTCYKTETINLAAGSTNYSCPSDAKEEGTSCVRRVTSTPRETSPDYTCDKAGYTFNATTKTCTKTDTIKATASTKTTYACPSGFNLSGTTCSKTVIKTVADKADVPSGIIAKTSFGGTCSGCANKTTYTYSTTTTQNATPSTKTTYTCPIGYTKSGSTCTRTLTGTYSTSTAVYCVSGYQLEKNDTVCAKYVTTSATQNTTSGSCPLGYTKNGTTCTKTSYANFNVSYTPSCRYGYTLYGSTCYGSSSTVSYANPTIKTVYSCPNLKDYKVEGNKCVHTTTKKVWSKSKKDSSLTKQGYKLTGKTQSA